MDLQYAKSSIALRTKTLLLNLLLEMFYFALFMYKFQKSSTDWNDEMTVKILLDR